MALSLAALPAALLLRADGGRGADQPCVFSSMVMPELEIRVRLAPRSQGLGQWVGSLQWRGRPLLPFRLSMAQGYGSRLWTSDPPGEGGVQYAIPFTDGQPYDALERRARVEAFLFAGLGSELYYRTEDGRRAGLYRAGEGFWRVGAGCRDRFLFGSQGP